MNFVTFIFSLLLLFSFGTLVVLEKQSSHQKLKTTFLGHIGANRKLLSEQVSETYQSLRGQTTTSLESKEKEPKKETSPNVPNINPECARLNLWPLIQDGQQTHPFLYKKTIHLINALYGKFLEVKPEIFLNGFLKKAKIAFQEQTFPLEKLSLDPSLQLVYYKMLKGTKIWDEEGYPSFLDIFKVDESPSGVCIHHAHPKLLNAFFGKKIGSLLYHEMQSQKTYPSKEMIEQVFAQSHLIAPEPDLYSLIQLGNPIHSNKGKMTLIAKDFDTNVLLRKTVYTNPRN
jgi:hypothetical protein